MYTYFLTIEASNNFVAPTSFFSLYTICVNIFLQTYLFLYCYGRLILLPELRTLNLLNTFYLYDFGPVINY